MPELGVRRSESSATRSDGRCARSGSIDGDLRRTRGRQILAELTDAEIDAAARARATYVRPRSRAPRRRISIRVTGKITLDLTNGCSIRLSGAADPGSRRCRSTTNSRPSRFCRSVAGPALGEGRTWTCSVPRGGEWPIFATRVPHGARRRKVQVSRQRRRPLRATHASERAGPAVESAGQPDLRPGSELSGPSRHVPRSRNRGPRRRSGQRPDARPMAKIRASRQASFRDQATASAARAMPKRASCSARSLSTRRPAGMSTSA